MNIAEFLESRIAEDEARARPGWTTMRDDSRWEVDNYDQNFLTPSAVLAECAAKRAIIEQWEDPKSISLLIGEVDTGVILGVDTAVRILAAVYKGHPDWNEEWA